MNYSIIDLRYNSITENISYDRLLLWINDVCCHWQTWRGDRKQLLKYTIANNPNEFSWTYELQARQYLILDEYDRIVSREILTDAVLSKTKKWFSFIRKERNRESLANWKAKREIIDESWEFWSARRDRYKYYDYHRHPQTTQERAFAVDIDHAPFVRGKRSLPNLPDYYDDIPIYIHRKKSWKALTKRKRQWKPIDRSIESEYSKLN